MCHVEELPPGSRKVIAAGPFGIGVFNVKGNAISRNMMLRISRRRWTCWNQLTFAFKTSAKRCFCEGSSGCQYAAKPDNE